ncbi:hypothetical protein [Legionella pneumophila]|uniref:hypothetical protein n=1 Tax=Legionella pneumophila TaxID=446 RepID=UPI0005C42E06|nr:hypothetical protein [Legionella pneumophila]GAN30048.1 hypothetical protein lpymt_01645 [Legionella pneumophila]
MKKSYEFYPSQNECKLNYLKSLLEEIEKDLSFHHKKKEEKKFNTSFKFFKKREKIFLHKELLSAPLKPLKFFISVNYDEKILGRFLIKILYRMGVEIQVLSSSKSSEDIFLLYNKLCKIIDLCLECLSPNDIIMYALILKSKQVEFNYWKHQLKEELLEELEERGEKDIQIKQKSKQTQYNELNQQQSVVEIILAAICHHLKRESSRLAFEPIDFSVFEKTAQPQHQKIAEIIHHCYQYKQSKLKQTYKHLQSDLIPNSNKLNKMIKLFARNVIMLEKKQEFVSQLETIAKQRKITQEDQLHFSKVYQENLFLLKSRFCRHS